MDQGLQRGQAKVGVLLLGLGAILAFFGAVGLILYFKPGGSSPAPDIFVAGPVEGFVPGTISYFQSEHLYIVRLADGAVLALYDLGPRMQMLFDQTQDPAWLECRAAVLQEDATVWAPARSLPVGFEDMVFREPCHGSTWDATGRPLFGPTTGNLDRFPVRVVDNQVRVDVSDRRCMNPVSAVAPCLPTQ